MNNLTFAEKFTGELDKAFVQKAVTGFLADNALRAKFVGAKTVMIPDVQFQGLGDYDRESGFTKGAMTVADTPFTIAMDRARSFEIDREDLDETGVAGLAGQVMGEFVRTKVAPECDAYVISKLAGLAAQKGQLLAGNVASLDTPYAALRAMIAAAREEAGVDEELVCLINGCVWNKLQESGELAHTLSVGEFKQGEIDLRVHKVDGVTLLPVSADRMYTAYRFLNGSNAEQAEGGFVPAANAKGIYMLVMPKRAASLVRKSDKVRIFSPEQNLKSDAYKFDYRIYYDVFVKKSGISSLVVWLAPGLTVSSEPADANKTAGSISGNLSVAAAASDNSTLSYQWFAASDANGTDKVRVVGANAASMAIPTTLEKGEYFYGCRVSAGHATTCMTRFAKVTVA